ncbi:hypothetical protein PHPALM_27822 [Phytophthora palmivora]|uniref:Uncharacterized protein n=1 Tax=Phytophthora palmivora TaxID=4796 RepID=A0A2P4XBM6_9STRA|nr:hypothetical protein PHPALM_27822 [Phytophthora palmivora]
MSETSSNSGDRAPTSGSPSSASEPLSSAQPETAGAQDAGATEGDRGATSGSGLEASADKRGETAQETSKEAAETPQVPEHRDAKAPKSRSSSAAKSTGKRSRSGSKGTLCSLPDVPPASTGAPSAAYKAQDLIQRALRPLLTKGFEKDDMDKLDALADAAVKARPAWRVKSLQHALLRLPLIFLTRTRCLWEFQRRLRIYPTGAFFVVVTVELCVFWEWSHFRKRTYKPDSNEFLLALKSVSTKRETASLLRHYGAQDLARKVFGMTTLMKRLLDKYRALEASTQRSSSQATRRTLKDFEEVRQVRANYSLLQKYWHQEAELAKGYIISELEKHTRDYKREAQEHERQERALQVRITRLESDHDELQKVVYDLENRFLGSLQTFELPPSP